MKRRLIKKWINRYIKPHTNDLPRTTFYNPEVRHFEGGLEVITSCTNQHVITNGHPVAEGERSRKFTNIQQVVIRTGECIKQIKRNHQHVFLRRSFEISGNRTYIRIITD